MPFAGGVAPAGWLKANGVAVSRSTYSDLFGVIGTTYGVGDGSTTFGLPDLRAEFIRGFDDGRGVDAGRGMGSNQSSYMPPIPTDGWGTSGNAPGSIQAGKMLVGSSFNEINETLESIRAAGGSRTLSGDVRPRNVAMLYCIKH